MNRKQFQEERQDEVDNGIYKPRSTSEKNLRSLKRSITRTLCKHNTFAMDFVRRMKIQDSKMCFLTSTFIELTISDEAIPFYVFLFNSDTMFDVAEILNCVNTREELYPNAYVLSFGEVYIDNPIQTICDQTSPRRVLPTDITGILDKHASSDEILSHGLNHEQDGRSPTNRAPPFSALLKSDLHSTKDELLLIREGSFKCLCLFFVTADVYYVGTDDTAV
ncbi:hypothetical protein V1477_009604 [Vespula maculifrons]|uniref:Uncharacterized protein n=1 Tax=Vespula maculifrons TaxID=7453 RepID=A0ABD2CAA1_VESMC